MLQRNISIAERAESDTRASWGKRETKKTENTAHPALSAPVDPVMEADKKKGPFGSRTAQV